MTTFARLSSPSAFRAVFANGRSYARGTVVVYATKRSDGGPPRVGFVVSRKVGSAVVRNRAKRLLREALRLEGGNVPEGVDLVVIARPSIASAGYHGIVADLRAALDAAGLGKLS